MEISVTRPTEIYPITQYAVSPPLTLTGRSFSWDSTLIDATTWSDGTNASNVWTFANTGTNTTMTASSALMMFSHGISATSLLLNLGVPADHLQYKFQKDSDDQALVLSNTDTTPSFTIFRLYPPEANKISLFQLHSNSTPGNRADNVRLSLSQSLTQATIEALKSGSGATPVLMLGAGGNSNLTLSGTTSTFGGNIIIPNNGFIGSVGEIEAIKIGSGGFVTFIAGVDVGSDLTIGELLVAEGNVILNDISGTTTLDQLTGPAGLCIDIDEKITHIRPNADMSGILWKIAGNIISPIDDFTNTYDVELDGNLAIGVAIDSDIVLRVLGAAGAEAAVGQKLELIGGAGGVGVVGAVSQGAIGGIFDMTSGCGGAATGGTSISIGGPGGIYLMTSGDGGKGTGSGSGSSSGGPGGSFILTSGAGGDADGTTFNQAGIAGTFQIAGGVGGDATSGTTNNGGAGGNVRIDGGAGGTGATSNGTDGSIFLGGTRGNVSIGSGLAIPTSLLHVGDGTNELQVSATGDLSFAGTGGFVEGHMTIPGVDIVVDTSGTADPVEVADDGTGVPDAGDGWASVYQNEVTFAVSDLHYQTVTIPATYKVIWDMSPKTVAGGGTIIHGGIMIDGVAVRDNGEGHAHIFNTNDNIQINGVGVIDCPNGNEEISLWISNNAGQKTLIEHGNMNVQLIGGT